MSKLFIQSLKLLGLIIAASALASCSAIKLAYTQAPELAYWWLDGYVDLSEAQKPLVRTELAALQRWHRKEELPKIADFLTRQAALMPRDVSTVQACTSLAEGRKLFDALTDKTLAPAAQLAISLTPAQLTHLRGKYAKVNAEYEKDYLKASSKDTALRSTKRFKQAVERSERLYGRLEEAQLAAVERVIVSSGFDAATSFKERVRRQQELLALLADFSNNKANAAQAETALRAYAQRLVTSPNPAYRSYSERLWQDGCDSFAAVHASTTATQRSKAHQQLSEWAADARALAAGS